MALYVKFECKTCENENCYGHCLPTTEKICNGYKHTTTNADRIRAKTDEELAEFESERMCCPPGKPGCEENNLTCDSCEQCWLDWLKQEASE